jgi:hypothetical protein
MASTQPRLSSEPISPPRPAEPERGPDFHVAPAADGWVLRVGTRIDATGAGEELLYQIWQDIHHRGMLQTDELHVRHS